VSEIAIFAGLVGAVVGYVGQGAAALVVGVVVCALGVVEVTAREHFSGYRSHTILLAAIPAAAVGTAVEIVFEPRQRVLVLLAAVPVYVVLFALLRQAFARARHARVVAPPSP
jgi:hypothetical protein